MNEPLVIIILVNYNGFQDTAECIESLKKSDYKNYKIVVVDNKSTTIPDIQLEQYIEENADAFIKSDLNGGFSYGNNLGIKYAQEKYNPDYYLLLNNDTIVSASFLSLLICESITHRSAGIITGRIMYYDDKDVIWYAGGEINPTTAQATHRYFNDRDCSFINHEAEKITFVTGCLMLITKETVNSIGLLDEKYFLYAEDTDYCLRAMNAGLELLFVPDSVIYHKVSRSTGATSKSTQYYMTRNQLMLIKKYATRKWKAFTDNLICDLRYIKQKKKSFGIVLKAYKDYLKKTTGRIPD